MNKEIELLHKKIEAQDKIINNQALEIARLNKQVQMLKDYGEKVGERRNELYDKIDKATEYIKEHNVLAVNKEYLPTGIERCCSAELLEILGDKE